MVLHNKLIRRPNVDTVAVQCFLVKDGCLLMGLRKNIFGDGFWGLPGGKLEKGETILEAGIRELRDETGLECETATIVALADGSEETSYHLQIGILIAHWKGTPEVREPHACQQWQFFPLTSLPRNIYLAAAPLIEKFKSGALY